MLDAKDSRKPIIPRSVLWIVPLVIVALELSIRLIELGFVDGRVGSLHNFIVQEGDFFYVRPGARVIQPERYGNTLYSINSHGFRGREIDSGSSARRILFVGDSITFGLYVGDEATYPALIEKMYEKRFADRIPLETINLSMFAYTPRQGLEVLDRIGWKLRPDLIVLQLYMNDFDPRAKPLPSTSQLVRERLFVLQEWLVSESALLRRVRQAVLMLSYELIHDLRRKYFVSTLNDDEPRQQAELFRRLADEDISGFDSLEQIHLQAEKAKVPLIAVLIPNEVQFFSQDFDIINQRVKDFCSRKGITFVDPLAAMRASDDKRILFVDRSHFSATGHRFIANWLFPVLFPGKSDSWDTKPNFSTAN